MATYSSRGPDDDRRRAEAGAGGAGQPDRVGVPKDGYLAHAYPERVVGEAPDDLHGDERHEHVGRGGGRGGGAAARGAARADAAEVKLLLQLTSSRVAGRADRSRGRKPECAGGGGGGDGQRPT